MNGRGLRQMCGVMLEVKCLFQEFRDLLGRRKCSWNWPESGWVEHTMIFIMHDSLHAVSPSMPQRVCKSLLTHLQSLLLVVQCEQIPSAYLLSILSLPLATCGKAGQAWAMWICKYNHRSEALCQAKLSYFMNTSSNFSLSGFIKLQIIYECLPHHVPGLFCVLLPWCKSANGGHNMNLATFFLLTVCVSFLYKFYRTYTDSDSPLVPKAV